MVDSVTKVRRSEIMRLIPVKNTKPERLVKSAVWGAGFRYGRSAKRKLPGSPDLVFPSLRAVIFVHGCFWHGHTCHLARTPKSNVEFWTNKIDSNKKRDLRVIKALRSDNWLVITVWECSLETSIRRAISVLRKRRELTRGHSLKPRSGTIRTRTR
ncbi:very short patch repair endonuclease [Polaromonas sp. YR568]|uniref:very short patch repair endonuclease n=1 Tax=Polaromonas sp. YR568 TaxID=1855301 RepID=UPI00398BE9D4